MRKRIKVVCSSCGHCGYVTDEAERIMTLVEAFGDTKFPCQECNGIYERALGDHPEKPVSFAVPAEKFWKFEYGPPEQRPKSVDDVLAKMRGRTIVDVNGRMEEDRCVIDTMVLDDGTVIWLGEAGRNQVVYRVKEGQHDSERKGSEG